MLDICPVSLAEANAFVAEHHRHHKPVVGHKFSIGCTDGEKIVGVAIVGRHAECMQHAICSCVESIPCDGLSQTDYIYPRYRVGDKPQGGWMEVRRTGRRASLDRQAPPGGRPLPRTNENPV